MGAYYEKYKKYLDLEGSSNMPSTASTVASTVQDVSSSLSAETLSALASYDWKELGQEQLVTSSIPLLVERIRSIAANINSSLVEVCKSSITELLPAVEDILEKEKSYEAEKAKLNSLSDKEKYNYNEEGKRLGEKQSYIDLKNSVASKEGELSVLGSSIDSIISKIKSYTVDDIAGTSSAGVIGEIQGLELTEEEKWFLKAAEEYSATATTGTMGIGTGLTTSSLTNDKSLGYSRIIKTSFGETIKVFQQGWSNIAKLRSGGCGWNALASILSTIDKTITPEKIYAEMGITGLHASNIKKYVESKYNIKVGSREEVPRKDYEAYKAKLIQELKRGNKIMLTVNSRTNAYFTENSHWIAIVDIDKNNNVYVTDSNDPKSEHAGAYNIDDLLKKYSVNSNVIYTNDSSGYGRYATTA